MNDIYKKHEHRLGHIDADKQAIYCRICGNVLGRLEDVRFENYHTSDVNTMNSYSKRQNYITKS